MSNSSHIIHSGDTNFWEVIKRPFLASKKWKYNQIAGICLSAKIIQIIIVLFDILNLNCNKKTVI